MFVARLFAWLDRALGGRSPADPTGIVNSGSPRSRPARPERPSATTALLSVDGAGQFLVCGADRLTLGHLRAGRADLGFLADVGSLHAVLTRDDSFQLGPGWTLAPCAGERVRIEGRDVPPEGRRWEPGECARLGENLELRLEAPDPASGCLRVEILHGATCAGARHLLLLAPGAGGRARIGATRAHHVPVPGLEFEIVLEWEAAGLRVRSEVPLGGEGAEREALLPFPPPARMSVSADVARGSRPPFGLSLEPVVGP